MNELVFPEDLRQLASQVLSTAADYWIATAESCTGGLVAACLTDIPGSSKSFNRGFVTYSNEAKSELIGVDPKLVEAKGAVSKEVAEAMAKGGLATLPSSGKSGRIAVAITGVAGPDGGTAEKPVGLVHFAVASARVGHAPSLILLEERFGNVGRAKIREKSVESALRLMLKALEMASDATATLVSRVINARPEAVFRAFLDQKALAVWLPPGSMTGVIHAFDAREGGGFHMSLVYPEGEGRGKTSESTDTFQGRFVKLVPNEQIVWAVEFESADPSFAGEMIMSTTLTPANGGTQVTINCENIPCGIRPEDNEAGCRSTLEKLASFLGG